MTKLKCDRCGTCCMTARPEIWSETNLTEFQKKLLLAEKRIYDKTPSETCCKALVYDKKIAICLVQNLFGKDHKPPACKDYFCDGKFTEKTLD